MDDTTPSAPDFQERMVRLSEQIGRAIDDSGLTLVELSKRSGICVPALSRIRHGKRVQIGVRTLLRISHGLGGNPERIMTLIEVNAVPGQEHS